MSRRQCTPEEIALTKHRGVALEFTPEYKAWAQMKSRCLNERDKSYARYGGRGITITSHWQNSFHNFLCDLGYRPTPQHSLDRINNDSGYCKDNCRWATKKQQSRNTKNNRRVTLGSETCTVAEWVERIGLRRQTFQERIRLGWTAEDALLVPSGGHRLVGNQERQQILDMRKRGMTYEEISAAVRRSHGVISRVLKHAMSPARR